MNDKILSLLGLIRRAGKLTFGYDTVLKSVKEKKTDLIILTGDISQHTMKDIVKAADDSNIRYIKTVYTKDDIAGAIGKYSAVICIEDKGFSQKLISLLETEKIREEE